MAIKLQLNVPLNKIKFPNKKVNSAGLILLYRSKVLLVRSTFAKDNENRDIWGFPKGKQESNETLVEAAIRETLEETGLPFNADDPCFSEAFCIYTIPRKNIILFKKELQDSDIPDKFKLNGDFNPSMLTCSTTLPNKLTPEIDKYILVPPEELNFYLFNHMSHVQEPFCKMLKNS